MTDRSGTIARYLKEIRGIRRLGRDEEERLLRAIERGNGAARETLIRSNLGFVVTIAAEYRGLGVPFEDLLNEGNLGLVEAARRFDSSRGVKFITYAVWWIRKKILQALTERTQFVRLPHRVLSGVRSIREAESDLRLRLGRQPTRREISDHLAMTEREVDRLLREVVTRVELDRPAPDHEEARLVEILADTRASAEVRLLRREAARRAARVLSLLPSREREVLLRRLGLAEGPPQTLAEIGDRLGLSRERVRQIQNRAETRLRRMLARRR